MRLPHSYLASTTFLFESVEEFLAALGENISSDERQEIVRLDEIGLPIITSLDTLALSFGYNPGFVWSLINHTGRHYRRFEIPKGKTVRTIHAPKVGLKAIQTWLNYRFQQIWTPIEPVHGFVPGKSHISAAKIHLGCDWVYSLDIENFFPSITKDRVKQSLCVLGYQRDISIEIVSAICCLNENLVQGAPTSPILSNIVLQELDTNLTSMALRAGAKYTRYADDIVFSGSGDFPEVLANEAKSAIEQDGWHLADEKEELMRKPNRRKVHGLLVSGDKIRLTKGYRNKIRAYRHMLQNERVQENDKARLQGHVSYSDSVNRYSS